jgi:hypothetical protein
MQRNFEPMRKLVEDRQRSELNDVTAKVVIYEAFVEGRLEAPKHLARTVHDLYFEPKYEEFRARTMWSLSNAFTSAFKELDPIPQFPRIASKRTANGTHENSCRVLREGFGAASIKVPGYLSHGVLHQFRRFARVTQNGLDPLAGAVPNLVCRCAHVGANWPVCGIEIPVPPNRAVVTKGSHTEPRERAARSEHKSAVRHWRQSDHHKPRSTEM